MCIPSCIFSLYIVDRFGLFVLLLRSTKQLLYQASCEDFDSPDMVFARVYFIFWHSISGYYEG